MDDFVWAEHQTPDGWRIPLAGNPIGHRYIRELDFAFEVWLGGDWDVTVRLERPFTLGAGLNPPTFDPRTTRKAQLAPLLGFGDATVTELIVRETGRLEVAFSNGSRIVADPTVDGRAWSLAWPTDVDIQVEARAGGGIDRPGKGVALSTQSVPDVSVSEAYPGPIRRGAVLTLPVKGVVTESSVSNASIELTVPISADDRYCLHFGGDLEIIRAGKMAWHGRGDVQDHTSLGPVLALIGEPVTSGYIDEAERLHLTFDGAAELMAVEGSWEMHWPKSRGSLDERWVPRQGPSIP